MDKNHYIFKSIVLLLLSGMYQMFAYYIEFSNSSGGSYTPFYLIGYLASLIYFILGFQEFYKPVDIDLSKFDLNEDENELKN